MTMSEETSTRLALPLLNPGQAQKEMTHNEALTLLDLTLGAFVRDIGVAEPPAAPAIGDCWLIGAAPVGAWAGQAHALAGWTAGDRKSLAEGTSGAVRGNTGGRRA